MDYGQFSALLVIAGLVLVGISSALEAQKSSSARGQDRWLKAAQYFGAAFLSFGLISCVLVAADLFSISFN